MVKDNTRNQTRKPSTNWQDTIDGWINDPTIRRHFLIALGMVLAAAVATVGFATSMPATILAGGVAGAGSTWWLRRRRSAKTSRLNRP